MVITLDCAELGFQEQVLSLGATVSGLENDPPHKCQISHAHVLTEEGLTTSSMNTHNIDNILMET